MVAIPEKTRPRFVLVDAHALLYRMHFAYAKRPLINSKGVNTSDVYGVAQFLCAMLRDLKPDYVAYFFDAGASGRDQIYSLYKATRKEMPEGLRAAIPQIEALLREFGIPAIRLKGYEADDLIGSYVEQAVPQGLDTVIVSGDKDFYQLLRPGVAYYNPGRGGTHGSPPEWLTHESENRLGVPPERVVDYLALIGDDSDNVPGMAGIGPVHAQRLIAQFGDLESILANAASVKHKAIRASLEANAENGRLSKRLVTIRRDIPLPLPLAQCRYSGPDYAAVRASFQRYEFQTLQERLAHLESLYPPRVEPPSASASASASEDRPAQPDLFAAAESRPAPVAGAEARRNLQERIRFQLYPRLSPEEFEGLAALLTASQEPRLLLDSAEVQPYLRKVAQQKGVSVAEIKHLFASKLKESEGLALDERAQKAAQLLRQTR